jgi:hemolysin III
MKLSYNNLRSYSQLEEILHSITHGFGFILSVIGFVLLVMHARSQGTILHIMSVSIFCSSLVILYISSFLYHSFRNPDIKRFFKIVDHAAIFLLIAGSYTPMMLINVKGVLGWSIFIIVWIIAITGIFIKIFALSKFQKYSIYMYLTMGWLCVLAIHKMIYCVPKASLILLMSGGLAYTIGAIFYLWKKLPYNHAIWHVFVLCGSACHYLSACYSF